MYSKAFSGQVQCTSQAFARISVSNLGYQEDMAQPPPIMGGGMSASAGSDRPPVPQVSEMGQQIAMFQQQQQQQQPQQKKGRGSTRTRGQPLLTFLKGPVGD